VSVVTPTLRARLRGARVWIALAAVALGGAIVVTLLGGSGGTGGRSLGPANPAPAGAKAVVEVLRDQGVDVTVTTSLDSTLEATRDADRTALVVDDADGFLTDDQWAGLVETHARLVLLAPSQTALDVVAPGVSLVGAADEAVVSPGCDLATLSRVDRVDAGGLAYEVDEADEAGEAGEGTVVACLATDAGAGLVEITGAGAPVTVVGATAALTNAAVASDDNAAYALSVLGQAPELVWYLPDAADLPEGAGTLATLTPSWVTPTLVLLLLTGVAAMVWRGRRLGPLVVERLPVAVRASETTEGRARLYERSGDRLHALDQLRIGALGRLARSTGLPVGASVDQIVERVAPLVSAPPIALRHVLVDARPSDDRELLSLSDALLDLERAVRAAAAPS
jgi:hypothetical protein